jgi:hypothetical protein
VRRLASAGTVAQAPARSPAAAAAAAAPVAAGAVVAVLERLDADSEQIREDIGRTIPKQLRLMGQMGIDFADEVARVYPDFPRKDLPRTWQAHLPALSPELQTLMDRWG